MKPILYNAEEKAFNTNGIGVLTDAISCKVKHVLNGQYELTMQYPVSGLHIKKLCRRMVILAKADPVSELQPFRIYRIIKTSSRIVTVYARHIAYDLNGIAVTPFAAGNVTLALKELSTNATPECPFTFTTDKDTVTPFCVAVPAPIWTLLGGSAGSILDTFGGEYEFDRWNVKLWNRRGMDRGVSIRYGKNLTSLEQDENCANCYTGVLPYWVDQSTNEVFMLPDRTVAAEGNFGYTKIFPLDLTGKFQQKPSESELETAARAYMKDNKICEPVIGWKVEFVHLEQTEEYKGMALLERVLLGDTVEVVFEELDISAKARAVESLYDSLLERYDYIAIGSVQANVADTIAGIRETAKEEAIKAVKGQTSEDVFNRLTDYGRIQGMYAEDNRWYINAEVAQIINLIATKLRAEDDRYGIIVDGASMSLVDKDSGNLFLEIYNAGFGAFVDFNDGDGNSLGSILGLPEGLSFSLYDQDKGDFETYKVQWKTVDGQKVLVGSQGG